MSSIKKTVFATAVAATLAGIAGHAGAAGSGPTYYGGGATLPAIGYVGTSQATTTNPANNPAYSTSGGEVSAFGYFVKRLATSTTATVASYCQTGSGTGRKVLIGTTDASGSCAALGATAVAFGAVGQTYGDFAGSDAPLSSAEFSTFTTNAGTSGSFNFGRGQAVQVPAVVGAVALLYRVDGLTAQVNLSPTNLALIFNGTITDWNDSRLGLGLSSSKPIKLVYRSDGSGTTFSFTNYMNGLRGAGVTTTAWVVDSTYTTAYPGAEPTGSVGASGNPGVVTQITGNDGSIGYVEAANAKAAANVSTTDGINFAKVNSKDPIANLPEAANTIAVGNVLTDQALGAVDANGRPTKVTLSPTTANCVLLVDPDAYSSPTSGYPIIAVSYLLFSSAGNSAGGSAPSNVTDLRNLGKFLVQSATYSGTTPVVNTINPATVSSGSGTTGYSSLKLTSVGTTILSKVTTATGCIGN